MQLYLAPAIATVGADPRHSSAARVIWSRGLALAARLAFELHDDDRSSAYYQHAEDAAVLAGDDAQLAAVRTSRAMVVQHSAGDVASAVALARAATRAAHRCPTAALRARAHAVHSEMSARAGHAQDAASSLDRARTSMQQHHPRDPCNAFDQHRLDGFDGLRLLQAGRAGEAPERLTRALTALHHERDAVQRGIVVADLALAHLKSGDVREAAGALHKAVDLAASTGARVPRRRVVEVRHRMRPWHAEPFIEALDDHLNEVLVAR